MSNLLVTRVSIEAPVSSFRYPFFLIGRQVSYDMPPPSTIYGSVASALGELPDASALRFGYHFQSAGRCRDLEHQHVIFAGGAPFEHDRQKYVTNVQGAVQPQERDFLFQSKLTLYLEGVKWADAFRHPVFCVALGRSQDLACITSVDVVELEQAHCAYLEQTLLPFSWRTRIGRGITVQMPRYIEPPPERYPHFARYVSLRDRIFDVDSADISFGLRVLRSDQEDVSYWVDPDTVVLHGAQRGIVFHSLVD